MEDFRPETFFQFVRTKKPIWFLKVVWIGSCFFLITLFILTFNKTLAAFWSYFIFIIMCLPAQALFYYSIAYRMYSYGRKAYLDLNNKNKIILNDVGVFIRRFNLSSKKSFYKIDITKTIYHFDKADIIICDTSIILLGKVKQFGSISYASPVEIAVSKKLTTISTAKLLNWTEERGRIIIDIKDEFYDKPFKIEFKDHIDQIKMWLKSVSPITKLNV